ncbi:MAG: T9SS type A sorting domain-containing protein [Bacteroidales bacterium]|nr:T9SS type A sorting domain-containing protein [Bacteroidales bacterium]
MNAKRMVTPEPLRIKGLTALVQVGSWQVTQKAPEYLYLYQKGAQSGMFLHDTSMILLDSVRWDTVTNPRYMKIPRYGNVNDYLYCYAYDVYFDKTIRVDSVFYICGTVNSNTPEGDLIPTIYMTYETMNPNHCHHDDFMALYDMDSPDPNFRWFMYNAPNVYGYYLPIVDNDSLSAIPADITKGRALGSGYYPHGHSATIEAVPNRGYAFDHWNDGDTANPRVITMTQDTTFTAYFSNAELHEVVAVPDDEAKGHVRGGGAYFIGDTVALTAVPEHGYRFSHWNDGDTANPRYFIVTRDTTFVAYFSNGAGLDIPRGTVGMTVSPNPAHTRFTVACPVRIEELTVMSANGATVLRLSPKAETATVAVADWQPGVYVVHARTANGSASRKIVVK